MVIATLAMPAPPVAMISSDPCAGSAHRRSGEILLMPSAANAHQARDFIHLQEARAAVGLVTVGQAVAATEVAGFDQRQAQVRKLRPKPSVSWRG